jgi:hypothetical protein
MEGYRVRLRVYDLSKGQARLLSPIILGYQIEGIWHTSVEVYGYEYYFQDGILCAKPGKTHHGEPLKVVDMGTTFLSPEVFHLYLSNLRGEYNAHTYNLFKNNCNHFSNDVVKFLVSKAIPNYILELPDFVLKLLAERDHR